LEQSQPTGPENARLTNLLLQDHRSVMVSTMNPVHDKIKSELQFFFCSRHPLSFGAANSDGDSSLSGKQKTRRKPAAGK